MRLVKNPPSEEGGFVNAPSKGALFTPALTGLALASLLSLDALRNALLSLHLFQPYRQNILVAKNGCPTSYFFSSTDIY